MSAVDEKRRVAVELLGAGELQEAERVLEELLLEIPGDLFAMANLGFLRYLQERFEECRDVNQDILQLYPDNSYALKGLGLALVELGELDSGIESLEKAIAADPGYFDPYYDLALVLHGSGEFQKARELLARTPVTSEEEQEAVDGLMLLLSEEE